MAGSSDQPESENRKARIAVLISGSGRSMVNLHNRGQAGTLDAKIALVIASRPGIAGLDRAAELDLPTQTVERKAHGDIKAYSQAVFDHVRQAKAEWVCLAGFLSLLRIPSDYAGRVLNIHPSLLPAFGGPGMYGVKVHQAVLDHGAKVSGCTVHLADDTYDTGPILVQKACPVLPGDDADDLAARVFDLECKAYPEALAACVDGRVHVAGRVATVDMPDSTG
ncbi:MAG: phosphoribosylglycinamide formyltransferase [Planctomycetota bacterium]